MSEVGARDRLVMAGLIILGLLTVVAGIMSGRSTLQYVLESDAGQAVENWTNLIDENLTATGTLPGQVLGENVEIIAPKILAGHTSPGNDTAPFSRNGGLVGEHQRSVNGLENFALQWVSKSRTQGDEGYVSKLGGFAVLAPDHSILATGGSFNGDVLKGALSDETVRDALDTAIATGKTQSSDYFDGNEGKPIAFVPIVSDGKLDRVYAFEVDQKAAAAMTDVALTVVSLATSLLIVMGFSVPAVIASRRIRERWRAEDQIRFLALHDSLTGLPNRLQLRQTLDLAILRCKRNEKPMAVLALDLDRFKDINDTLGHPAGDALLQEVATRLRANVREVDLVGRLGGDEFTIVAEQLDSPEDVLPLARRICTALGETYRIDGHDVISSTSIGIAIAPIDGETGDQLLKNADLALYRAKQDGRNTYRFFEPSMDAALQKRRRLENDLRVAIRKNQLHVEYQPQFDLKTGTLTGYEALARWHHPTDGDIPPSVFLPLAEETGLIGPIGEWVLRTAAAYATTWPKDTKLAVNLSPAQFKVQNVTEMVRRILDETGFEPRRLELEITESLLLQNSETVVGTLEALDRLGVSIAMDDFGTGYSSLSYLTRFPVRKIKIDRSFIETLGEDKQSSAIVNSIVGLGKSLDVTITAEGVETQNQAELLKRWGCNEVQGYFFGGPEDQVEVDRQVHSEQQDRQADDEQQVHANQPVLADRQRQRDRAEEHSLVA
ncbi:EAL domain-containing protein [Methyloligella sp. 2.7D]|uniref:putative bifunctional diguanylate cyclase/phosphodiesterase n=1 Tax=unclassified Methyloligella TaxID=2625955 RepID=UPI00157DB604|nr:EAL domain-containing protein [Methyloligella sp. GL2]QKP76305.1 EAL domain-containing protein [Methyloligella sp. GL2]